MQKLEITASVLSNIIFKTKKNKERARRPSLLVPHYIYRGSVVIGTIWILKRCKVKSSIVSAYSKAVPYTRAV